MRRAAPPLAAALLALGGGALAQSAPPMRLDTVVISARHLRQSEFDAAAAISAVTRDDIDEAGPQVNLSEALNRVPGISVLNRQNYAACA